MPLNKAVIASSATIVIVIARMSAVNVIKTKIDGIVLIFACVVMGKAGNWSLLGLFVGLVIRWRGFVGIDM